jgi:methionyl-tRNA formyltransferase
MGAKQAGIIGLLTALAKGHRIVRAVSYSEDLSDLLGDLRIPGHRSIHEDGFVEAMKNADLLLSVHGREIVGRRLLEMPKLGAINVHPFLYKYKGANPVERALTDGEKRGSVGVHFMTERVDEGPVVCEEFIELPAVASVVEVYNLLYPLYARAIARSLDELERG